MKQEVNSLELHYLVDEFQLLIGGKLDKVYVLNKTHFLFLFHVPKLGKKMLRVLLPTGAYLTSYKGEQDSVPSGFCMFLRKHLGNARVREIKQIGCDRAIDVLFSTKDKVYHLIIEFFAKGNLLLCDEDYKILSCVSMKKMKDRTIRGGVKYTLPASDVNFFSVGKDEFFSLMQLTEEEVKERMTVSKKLALGLRIGGLYSMELCFLAGIDPKATSLSEGDLEKLYGGVEELRSKKLLPIVVYGKEGEGGEKEVKEILPFEINKYASFEQKKYESFSEAIDAIFSKTIIEKKKAVVQSKYKGEIDRLQKIVDMQEQQITGQITSAEENQRKGELLYEKYTEVKEILDSINKARTTHSWAEIKEKLKGHDVVKSINEKKGELVIELSD